MKLTMPMIALIAGLLAGPGQAQTVRFHCGGTEPFWELTLTDGWARLRMPDQPARDFSGRLETREFAKISHWRGKGQGGELVAFVEQRECSDGMSEIKYPHSVRVSVGPEQWLLGCCQGPR